MNELRKQRIKKLSRVKKRKYEILKKRIAQAIFVLLVLLAIVNLKNIFLWKIDSNNTLSIEKEIQNISDINEIEDSDNTEIIGAKLENDKSNPYWDYIKMNLLNVDFTNLKQLNNETKGWLQVNGTNINYPFVQGNDNAFYLNHSFDKKANSAGWVFLDYRNELSQEEKNTIIYAHRRKDLTLFGTLKNIFTSEWQNDKNNHVVKISTEHENTLWQVFSVYYIPTTNDYIRTEFGGENDFQEFVDMLKSRSMYNFNTEVSSSDRILTLSTCHNQNDKAVLHAKLIKRELK